MEKAENSTNTDILEAELFLNHTLLSMPKNNFCDASEAPINVHQSVKNSVDFVITEVVRKNFTANISSKNIPVQELQSLVGHNKASSAHLTLCRCLSMSYTCKPPSTSIVVSSLQCWLKIRIIQAYKKFSLTIVSSLQDRRVSQNGPSIS